MVPSSRGRDVVPGRVTTRSVHLARGGARIVISTTLGRSRWRRARAVLAAAALALALPVNTLASGPDFVTSQPAYLTLTVPGSVYPLVSSGDVAFGTTFEGIPDGIGVIPNGDGTVEMYVTHEQSQVPFGGFADFSDSSVTHLTVDLTSQSVTDMSVALPESAGFIRFCSAFMAGPDQGFPDYTFLVNEESNDNLVVPAGATYGADPSLAPYREAGYSVWLDPESGAFAPISRMGRHNHENQVVVPGGWSGIASLSGDDTFSAPSSQLYLFTSRDAAALKGDKGQLWAFQVTTDDGVPVDPYDAFNNANDYLDLSAGESFSGRFIHVPTDIARGVTAAEPQQGLEDWSNANNVFQFIRVEDIAYDPDSPRTIYFADTGASVAPNPTTGRLSPGASVQRGRIFKMVMNSKDPRIVDSLSVLADGNDAATNFNHPDNVALSHASLMVQEDTSGARIWRYDLASGGWSVVANVIDPPGFSGTPPGESSGILDLGNGWWALDVQSHRNQLEGDEVLTWTGPPGPPVGTQYRERREHGQLLLINIPGT
jgi:hypothetical protein